MMGGGNNNTISTEVNSSYITDWNTFSQLTQKERNDSCTITPWYEIPNGWCSDKGTMSDEHWYAALEYGKQTGADSDTAIQETYDASFFKIAIHCLCQISRSQKLVWANTQTRKTLPSISEDLICM